MSTAGSAPFVRPPRALMLLAFVAAAGIAAGWSFAPSHSHALDFARALLEAAWIGVMCFSLLQRTAKPSRWLVPVVVTLPILMLISHPPMPLVTSTGVGAGLVAVLSSLLGHRRLAIAATLACCAFATARSFASLLSHHQSCVNGEAKQLD